MSSLQVKIVNRSSHPLPSYATEGSAGMDLRAHIEEPVQLEPGDRALLPTGLFIELPMGYEAQIRPRSGLAYKHGITCMNAPGTIDADYRGEIKVLLINLSKELQTILPGDRIAQLVIHSVAHVRWELTDTLSDTIRSEGGFGHTGKN